MNLYAEDILLWAKNNFKFVQHLENQLTNIVLYQNYEDVLCFTNLNF